MKIIICRQLLSLMAVLLFWAAVPEADVCSGSGSGCFGKPVRTDPWSVGGRGGLFLRTLPGNRVRVQLNFNATENM